MNTEPVNTEIETLGHKPPVPGENWALFLDLDGTLLDIAERPEAIVVPHALIPALRAAAAWLDGALAIVSGRTLLNIDAILSPLVLPCAGEHGAVVRLPGGAIEEADPACAVPGAWKRQIESVAGTWPGVAVEMKEFNVTVHFRQVPDRQDDVLALLKQTVDGGSGFEVLPARMAYELRHSTLTKASAVRSFMRMPPFAGRIPVFVGDDVTDEDGFRAAEGLSGLALHVATSFGGKPAHVRQWLESFCSAPTG
jgi:trehalose 6-phosphate phosphatase